MTPHVPLAKSTHVGETGGPVMKGKSAVTTILAVNLVACGALAGIPEPSAVLYGTLTVDGQTITASDGVTVVARVDGVTDPVGTYHMGDNPAAQDNYVLRIRLESLADGSSQSDNAALVGQTVHVTLFQGAGPQRPAADFQITAPGVVANLDLSVSGGITWQRAVYFDETYPTVWTSGTVMRDLLADKGYDVLDADALKIWMDARIADAQPSVVVFSQDAVPDTVTETMSPDCTLRRYLDAGGKIVWYADIPLYYQGHAGGTTTVWGVQGSIDVLGFNAAGGPWDSADEVSFTGDGLNWGLRRNWRSQRPTETANQRVLAQDDDDYAAAWVRHYVEGDTYRGFVRLYDRPGTPNGHDVRQSAVFGNQLPPPVDNDWDGDDDVDLSDYIRFRHCLGGPDTDPTPVWGGITIQNCLDAFDSEEDADVDLADFAAFQEALGADGL